MTRKTRSVLQICSALVIALGLGSGVLATPADADEGPSCSLLSCCGNVCMWVTVECPKPMPRDATTVA